MKLHLKCMIKHKYVMNNELVADMLALALHNIMAIKYLSIINFDNIRVNNDR